MNRNATIQGSGGSQKECHREVNSLLDFRPPANGARRRFLAHRPDDKPYFAIVQRIFHPARTVPTRFPEILDRPAILFR
jgi:hypothetical protein